MGFFRRAGLVVQSLFYIGSGINHFLHAEFYRRIMPDHYAHPNALVGLSGVAEIAGGLGLLVPAARRLSAGGIMLMLLVFLDVHLFMLRNPERFPAVPSWVLWLVFPFSSHSLPGLGCTPAKRMRLQPRRYCPAAQNKTGAPG